MAIESVAFFGWSRKLELTSREGSARARCPDVTVAAMRVMPPAEMVSEYWHLDPMLKQAKDCSSIKSLVTWFSVLFCSL